MSNNKTAQNNLTKSSSVLRIIGLLLVLTAFIVFIYNTKKQETDIVTQKLEIIKQDSIIAKGEVLNNRIDTLKTVVTQYFKLRTEHNADELDKLYADSLDFYFKNLKNCNKKAVKQSDKRYWSKYKNDIFKISGEPEFFFNEKSAKAIIKGQQCTTLDNCIEEIVEIQFDNNNKIRSVKAYFAK